MPVRVKRKEIGIDSALWYRTLKNPRFVELLESIGVSARVLNPPGVLNSQVKLITDPKELDLYFQKDVWDLREIFAEYPRHRCPSTYIARFSLIKNPQIRVIVKRYFRVMISQWKPRTFDSNLRNTLPFLNTMNELFPDITSFSQLDRERHLNSILTTLPGSPSRKYVTLTLVRAMFKHMYLNRWQDGPASSNLIIDYDKPSGVSDSRSPRPILPEIKIILDNYVENTIVPLLESGKEIPFVEPMIWDAIIVQRYTGRRYEDIAHLLADGSDSDCLRYDVSA